MISTVLYPIATSSVPETLITLPPAFGWEEPYREDTYGQSDEKLECTAKNSPDAHGKLPETEIGLNFTGRFEFSVAFGVGK